MDQSLIRLSDKAERRSIRRGEEPHYRCLLCWVRTPWHEGVADSIDRRFSSLVDQRLFVDIGRRRRAQPVTDAGVCSDCWCVLETIPVTETHEEAMQQLPVAPGCASGLLGS